MSLDMRTRQIIWFRNLATLIKAIDFTSYEQGVTQAINAG